MLGRSAPAAQQPAMCGGPASGGQAGCLPPSPPPSTTHTDLQTWPPVQPDVSYSRLSDPPPLIQDFLNLDDECTFLSPPVDYFLAHCQENTQTIVNSIKQCENINSALLFHKILPLNTKTRAESSRMQKALDEEYLLMSTVPPSPPHHTTIPTIDKSDDNEDTPPPIPPPSAPPPQPPPHSPIHSAPYSTSSQLPPHHPPQPPSPPPHRNITHAASPPHPVRGDLNNTPHHINSPPRTPTLPPRPAPASPQQPALGDSPPLSPRRPPDIFYTPEPRLPNSPRRPLTPPHAHNADAEAAPPAHVVPPQVPADPPPEPPVEPPIPPAPPQAAPPPPAVPARSEPGLLSRALRRLAGVNNPGLSESDAPLGRTRSQRPRPPE